MYINYLIYLFVYYSLYLNSDIIEAENLDLQDIVTPVKVKVYGQLLKQAGYDQQKTAFFIEGFTKGFSLEYQGPKKVTKKVANLKLIVGSPTELWNKNMTEVKAKRSHSKRSHTNIISNLQWV